MHIIFCAYFVIYYVYLHSCTDNNFHEPIQVFHVNLTHGTAKNTKPILADVLKYVSYIIGLILNIFAETHSQYTTILLRNKEERYSRVPRLSDTSY